MFRKKLPFFNNTEFTSLDMFFSCFAVMLHQCPYLRTCLNTNLSTTYSVLYPQRDYIFFLNVAYIARLSLLTHGFGLLCTATVLSVGISEKFIRELNHDISYPTGLNVGISENFIRE